MDTIFINCAIKWSTNAVPSRTLQVMMIFDDVAIEAQCESICALSHAEGIPMHI